jgi:hypothetical protein
MTTTSKSDFKKFSKCAQSWVNLLVPGGWDILVRHSQMDYDNLATCAPQCSTRTATIALNKSIDTTDDSIRLDNLALHEVLHLLLADYSRAARDRFATDAELDRAEEDVVLALVRGIMKKIDEVRN